MGQVKQFKISTSFRTKGYELLSRYEPSDLIFTLGGSLFDRMNKMQTAIDHAHSKEQGIALTKKKAYLRKAALKIVALSKNLKMMEM